ncbi:MAG: 16S rRNA processing protein RimM [Chloroflexaceae bacterium]|nr:16S rRNA processing protein RimM [Chloroflexaceae bacterium]
MWTSNSPNPDELLLIGRVGTAFGVHGQIKFFAVTDRPDHLIRHVRTVYIGQRYAPYTIQHIFEHKTGLFILRFKEITTREAAAELRNADVYMHQNQAAPLDEDEYFLHDLYGLRVESTAGEPVGTVTDVLQTGANDVLVVTREGQPDAMIPMIRDVIAQLDIANGCVVIRVIDNLL